MIKLAIAQTEIFFEELNHNFKNALLIIQEAGKRGYQGVLFPEMSFTGFTMNVNEENCLKELHHNRLAFFAKNYNIGVGYGYIRMCSDGTAENRYRLIHSDGTIALDYCKMHPFSYCGEQLHYTAGDIIKVEEWLGMKVSVQICYDLRFPVCFSKAAQHADMVIVPANWLSLRHSQFGALLQARAIENQVYTVGINCVGAQGNNQFWGGSCAYDPEGVLLAQAEDQYALKILEIDSDLVSRTRQNFPVWADRRDGERFI